MSASLQAAQVIRCINSGVSCLASTFIVLMILTEPEKGLASPYSRIIFGMSVSDILFSLGLLLSPFMSPKDNPDALFAIGTTESCEGIGFLFTLGVQCLLYYTLLLTYYFMRRIKYKVTPQNFAKKEERYFHVAFIIIAISVATTSLATGSINPQTHSSLCGIGSYKPVDCDESTDMACERGGGNVTKAITAIGGSFMSIAFFALIVILTLCTDHVYRVERQLNIPAREIGNVSPRSLRSQDNEEEKRDEAEVQANELDDSNMASREDTRKEKNRLILTKQAFQQSLFYILAFIFVYLGPMITIFQKQVGNSDMSEEPEWRFWIKALITPLGGVFNILIYTRPKVLKCKESYPRVPMFKLFFVVLISGGEIPSMVDVKQRREWRNYSHADENHRPLRNRAQSNIGDGEQQQQDDDNDSHSKYEVLYDMDISDAEELLSMMEYARNGYLRSVLGTTAYNQR